MNRSYKLKKNGGNETVKEKKNQPVMTWLYMGLDFTDQKKTVKEHLSPRKFPNTVNIFLI